MACKKPAKVTSLFDVNALHQVAHLPGNRLSSMATPLDAEMNDRRRIGAGEADGTDVGSRDTWVAATGDPSRPLRQGAGECFARTSNDRVAAQPRDLETRHEPNPPHPCHGSARPPRRPCWAAPGRRARGRPRRRDIAAHPAAGQDLRHDHQPVVGTGVDASNAGSGRTGSAWPRR